MPVVKRFLDDMLQRFDLNADRRIGKASDMLQIGGKLFCKRLVQFRKRNIPDFIVPADEVTQITS